MRKYLGWTALAAASTLVTSSPVLAATFNEEVASLVGEWEGQAPDGTTAHLSFTAGQDSILLSGNWRVSGGTFAKESGLSLLRMGGSLFLLPDSSPFTAAQPVYSVSRLPGGGIRAVQLQHDATDAGMTLRVEEVRIGKQKDDGTRVLHMALGDKLCADGASLSGKACGGTEAQDIVLHKVTQ